jgi:prepilin-type N-terminal cleavage/methylation domain-containing protein
MEGTFQAMTFQEAPVLNELTRPRPRAGFTIIELMFVVVVVGVLALIAVPIYGNMVQNARVSEGLTRIGDIITAAKCQASQNLDSLGDPIWPSGSAGILDLSPTENFTYAITAGGGQPASTSPLTILASGTNGMDGATVEVTVDNMRANGNPPIITLASASGGNNGNGGGNGGGNGN